MSRPLPVITISRQCGSRGRETGKALAKLLELPYYDYAILEHAAKQTGLAPQLFEQAETSAVRMQERLMKGLPAADIPINTQIFEAQAKIIRQLAQKGACVIVGRCADTILKDHPNAVHLYLYASLPCRIANTAQKKALSPAMAERFIRQVDQGRSAYHNFFSDHSWGDMNAYDLCICTDQLTPQAAAQSIAAFLGLVSTDHKEDPLK